MERNLKVNNLERIVKQLNIDCYFIGAEPLGNGLINDTYKVTVGNDEGNVRYIVVQRVNHNVFKNVPALMDNIEKVTKALKMKIMEENGNVVRESLTVIHTKDGANYVLEEGNYYRAYIFIENAISLEQVENKSDFAESAVVSATFQRRLIDFPAETLTESIPDFHNTVKRYENFKIALEKDTVGRAKELKEQIDFIEKHKHLANFIVDKLNSKELPYRVTHNDTKLNNIMFDKKTRKGLCLIDFDTIMPGSMLYDVGDAIRSACWYSDKGVTKFSQKLYNTYYKAFVSVAGDFMTEAEKKYFAYGGVVMTYESVLRFVTDYLDGDTYFKITYEKQNLDRANDQICLLTDMLKKLKIQ